MKKNKIVKLLSVGGTSIIAGKTGSGKTLLATHLAGIASSEGIPVFTNIDIKIDNVNLLKNGSIPELLHNEHTRNFVVIIDEYATVNLESEQKERLVSHLVQARKHWGGHWIFIAQDYRFFDVEIRRLALWVWETSTILGIHKVKVLEQTVYEKLYSVGGSDWDSRKLRKNVFLRLVTPKRNYNLYNSFDFVDVGCFGSKKTSYPSYEKLSPSMRRELSTYSCLVDKARG